MLPQPERLSERGFTGNEIKCVDLSTEPEVTVFVAMILFVGANHHSPFQESVRILFMLLLLD